MPLLPCFFVNRGTAFPDSAVVFMESLTHLRNHMVGVARRSWARNEHAVSTAVEYNEMYKGQDHITLPYVAENDDEIIRDAIKNLN